MKTKTALITVGLAVLFSASNALAFDAIADYSSEDCRNIYLSAFMKYKKGDWDGTQKQLRGFDALECKVLPSAKEKPLTSDPAALASKMDFAESLCTTVYKRGVESFNTANLVSVGKSIEFMQESECQARVQPTKTTTQQTPQYRPAPARQAPAEQAPVLSESAPPAPTPTPTPSPAVPESEPEPAPEIGGVMAQFELGGSIGFWNVPSDIFFRGGLRTGFNLGFLSNSGYGVNILRTLYLFQGGSSILSHDLIMGMSAIFPKHEITVGALLDPVYGGAGWVTEWHIISKKSRNGPFGKYGFTLGGYPSGSLLLVEFNMSFVGGMKF